jgi:hypothetical protein
MYFCGARFSCPLASEKIMLNIPRNQQSWIARNGN